MLRVQSGDTEAFAQLYDRHSPRAYRVAQSVCRSSSSAEDAVQDGFLSIWRSRGSYRPGKGSFKAWSMRVVQNRAIDTVRRERPAARPAADELADDLPDLVSPSVQDQVVAGSEGVAVRGALAHIPPAQAEVITLAFFGGLSHSEIAHELALPAGTVKGRMRLGLEKLRQRMEARV